MKTKKTCTSCKSKAPGITLCRLCTGGELFDRIVAENHFSEEKSAIVFKQILQSILYTHKNNIVHRY